MRKRGEVTMMILDAIANTATTIPAVICSLLDSGYGASIGHREYIAKRYMDEAEDGRFEHEERRARYQRFSMMLRYLRENNIISERKVGDYVKLYLTPKGRTKRLSLKKEAQYSLPVSAYKASPGKKFVIVVYDIPVRFNRYRNWLRDVLRKLGLKKLQKSVWIGKVIIPDQLLSDLMKYKLEEFVEIIEVNSSGTMRELI
jgi:CRISPR/Cas system-associated endoribonuclease Cas2